MVYLVHKMMTPINKRDDKTGKATVEEKHQYLDYEELNFSAKNLLRLTDLELKIINQIRGHEYSYLFIAEKMLFSCERKKERKENYSETFEMSLLILLMSHMTKDNPLYERYLELLDTAPDLWGKGLE